MVRHAKRLALALIIGVLVNIALATVPSVIVLAEEVPVERVYPAPRLAATIEETLAEHFARLADPRRGALDACILSESNLRFGTSPGNLLEGQRRLGIPWRSMAYDFGQTYNGVIRVRNGFVVSQHTRSRARVVPLAILWPGFTLNTLVFALGAFAALLARQHLITTYRRRHSRCPACGYSTTGLGTTTCPECAAALRAAPPSS